MLKFFPWFPMIPDAITRKQCVSYENIPTVERVDLPA